MAGSDLYDERERRALQFLELMCNDHYAIDDDTAVKVVDGFVEL